MEIMYKDTKEFTEKQLEELFLSVNWKSGKYPKRLAAAMKNSSVVISAWYCDELVGLIRSLDDGATTAFIHYLLVKPDYQNYHIGGTLLSKLLEHYENYLYIKIMPSDKNTIPFYKKFGFNLYDNYCAMEIDRLETSSDELP